MTISSAPAASVLSNLMDRTKQSDGCSEVGIRMLKKANDQMKQQGEALVAMIEQAGAPASNQFHLDVYA